MPGKGEGREEDGRGGLGLNGREGEESVGGMTGKLLTLTSLGHTKRALELLMF